MYGENEFYREEGGSSYGAAPEINQSAAWEKRDKKKKKEHPVWKKCLGMAGSGVVFGLAAALSFIGIVKSSGIEKSLRDAAAAYSEARTAGGGSALSEAQGASAEEGIPATNVSRTTGGASEISEIVKEAMPSIVSITTQGIEEVRSMFGTQKYQSTGSGSGIIIGENEEELLIATNNHVVSGSTELTVCFGDNEESVAKARVKGTDVGNDLAIIAVSLSDLSDEIRSSIKIATILSSEEPQVGDQVIAIGNALGYGQSVTTGIISALDREVSIEDMSAQLIQTDAAINPGNSGGALLNMKGELIGINSSKLMDTRVEGMGYAIPISIAEPILQNLMNRETRDPVAVGDQGVLGISCQNVSEDISEMYNIPRGVYVLGTQDGSAAEKAGLKKGDIITAFDGISLTSYDNLKSLLQYYKAGEEVELTVQRAGEDGGYGESRIKITLDANTDAAAQNRGGAAQGEDDPAFGFDGGSEDGSDYGSDVFDFFDYFFR